MVSGFNANKCQTEIPIVKVIMFSSSGFQVRFFTRVYWNQNWFLEVLQTCRALMIAAIGLGFLGILLSVLGMKCTSVGASNHKAKARTALLGGLMLGVAGRWALHRVHSLFKCTFSELVISIQSINLRLGRCLSCYFKVFYRWVKWNKCHYKVL